ncbi:MAG: DegT/DnrJ/EryC1/StrS aminotransferase family protein [bacterium]|nr:DegT/DnrJ/EryC1/StrS aminotransferase family protein [bacterium]
MPPIAKIPLYDLALSRAAIAETTATLRSGWLATGAKAKAFELKIAAHCGIRHAAAVSSATAGLQLALYLAAFKGGSEVITTPYTFIATTTSIIAAGLTPVYCDIDPDTLNLDTAKLARKITRRTGLILPVDIAGHPCDYSAMREICKGKEIQIVSDSAHAFGSLYRGEAIPHWTDLSVFSFHATKNLTTGEGGAILSRNGKLIERARRLSRHGITRDAWMRKQGRGWQYDIPEIWMKGNLPDILASIGLGELTTFDQRQAKRRKIVERYAHNLRHMQDYLELPVERPNCLSAWHLYIIKLVTKRLTIDRAGFIEAMARKSVECGVHYIPIPDFSAFAGSRPNLGSFPVMDEVAPRTVTLPLYPTLSLKQVDYICESIEAVIKRNIRRTR